MAELYHAHSHKYVDRYKGKNGQWVYVYPENSKTGLKDSLKKIDYSSNGNNKKYTGPDNKKIGVTQNTPMSAPESSYRVRGNQKLLTNGVEYNKSNNKGGFLRSKESYDESDKNFNNYIRNKQSAKGTSDMLRTRGAGISASKLERYNHDEIKYLRDDFNNQIENGMYEKEKYRNSDKKSSEKLTRMINQYENPTEYKKNPNMTEKDYYRLDVVDKANSVEDMYKKSNAKKKQQANREAYKKVQDQQRAQKRYEEARNTYAIGSAKLPKGLDDKKGTNNYKVLATSNRGTTSSRTEKENVDPKLLKQIHLDESRRVQNKNGKTNPASDPKKYAEEQRAKKKYEEGRYTVNANKKYANKNGIGEYKKITGESLSKEMPWVSEEYKEELAYNKKKNRY